MLLPRGCKPFQNWTYWNYPLINNFFCSGLWSVLNRTFTSWKTCIWRGRFATLDLQILFPLGKRWPLSRLVVSDMECCFVIAQHCCLDLAGWSVCTVANAPSFCWKWLVCYFQVGTRRKGRRMGFCQVIFPTWGCTEDLLKEKKLICVHVTCLLFSGPQSAFSILGGLKSELMRLLSPSMAFLYISALSCQ